MIMIVGMDLMKIPAQMMSIGHVLRMNELVTVESVYTAVNGVMVVLTVAQEIDQMKCFAMLNVIMTKSSNASIHPTASLKNGSVMEIETVQMAVMRNIAPCRSATKENSLVNLISAHVNQVTVMLLKNASTHSGNVTVTLTVVMVAMKTLRSAKVGSVNQIVLGVIMINVCYGVLYVTAHTIVQINLMKLSKLV